MCCFPRIELLRPYRIACRILLALSFLTSTLVAADYTESNEDPYEPEKIAEFTGAPTRVAWIQDGNDVPAVDAERPTLRLMGWDSEDGRGERAILPELAAYIKPLITADGSRVVFGDNLKKTVSVVNWDGTGLRVLIEDAEFADVWTDPSTGVDWVYATVQEDRGGKEVPVIRRYRMDDPSVSELVWDKMPVYMFTLAGDGRAASGGGDGGNSPQGFLTLPNGKFTQRAGGCWPSIAPDSSYRMWVFTGNHRSVHFYVPTNRSGTKAEHSVVQLDESPGLSLGGREEVHRLRWSNNTRFMVCSSPFSNWNYRGEVKIPDEVSDKIEIYIGKFSEDLSELEEWMRVTSNNKGDYWADVWIEPGEGAQAEAMAITDLEQDLDLEEELDPSELLYTWETGAVGNQIDDPETGSIRQSTGRLRGYATFGLYHVMDLEEGWFEADDMSARLLEAAQSNQALTLEAILTPLRESGGDQVILLYGDSLESAQAAIFQRGDELYFRMNGQNFFLGEVELERPHHLVVSYNAQTGEFLSTIGGRKAMVYGSPDGGFSDWEEAPLVFGAQPDGTLNWSGLLEGIRIFARPMDWAEARLRERLQSEAREDRLPVEPILVRAKLLELSDAARPEEIAPYRRCLNVNLYEVQEVVDGHLEDRKIAVAQWSVLDAEVVPEYESMEEGSVQLLSIEPWSRHPEQESERKIEGMFFDDVQLFYDTSPIRDPEDGRDAEAVSSEEFGSGVIDLTEPMTLVASDLPLEMPPGDASRLNANGQRIELIGDSLQVEVDDTVELSGNGKVAAVTVVHGGLDYTRSPLVRLTGTGEGAVAEAGMSLSSIDLTHLGAGYTSEPTVTISPPDVVGGRQATAKARWNEKSGALDEIRITDEGSGYVFRPTVEISGGEGQGAKAEAYLFVSDVYVTDGGSGYSVPPLVEFSQDDGIGSRARAATQSTLLQATNHNADILLRNEGRLGQFGASIVFDWAAQKNQPGARRFENEGDWIMRNGSLKFVSSTGRPTWFGTDNVNRGDLRVLDHSWLGFSRMTNTGNLELGEGAVLGQAEFARSENRIVNEGDGKVWVSGGTVEDPVVFGIDSFISNGDRLVINGSEESDGTARWTVGGGTGSAAFRVSGGQVEFINHREALLEIARNGSLLLETNDAGARHQFERRRAKVDNRGGMKLSGALYVRSNHSSFGGIDNSGLLIVEGEEVRLVRLMNSVGPGGLYKAPDYTSLIANRPEGKLVGSGTFTYVDQTGEENAHYMRILNQGNLRLADDWILENVNLYFGAPIPGNEGIVEKDKPVSAGGTLTVSSASDGFPELIVSGVDDSGLLSLSAGVESVLEVVSDFGPVPSGRHRIVTAVAVEGEFGTLRFNGSSEAVPYTVEYHPDGIDIVFP